MKEDVNKKVQVLMQKAKESKTHKTGNEKEKTQSGIPNSLADHIKTQEQAKSFMTLLNSL